MANPNTPDVRADRTLAERLTRDPGLVAAAQYRRTIGASLDRVWENVFDWEHLPWLHASSFGDIALLDSGDWGWHVRVGYPGGAAESEIELVADTSAGRYVARTLEGLGAGGEIWTQLARVDDDATDIVVDFCVEPAPQEQLETIGRGYLGLYKTLWNEDEEMMQHREAALREPRPATAVEPLSLGPLEDLRRRLPLELEFGGRPFRILDVMGELVIHSTRCPHSLGPLDGPVDAAGVTVCPWHGYAFNLKTGMSCDDKKLRLTPSPRIKINNSTTEVIIQQPN